jgi:hypothetical protein
VGWKSCAKAGKNGSKVLFSNTAHAHQAHKTRDWVVIYYDGGQGERHCTVITAERRPMEGRRIVCGREGECSATISNNYRIRTVGSHPRLSKYRAKERYFTTLALFRQAARRSRESRFAAG